MADHREMSNQRVALGIYASEAARYAGVRTIDLLDWEYGGQGLARRHIGELAKLYEKRLVALMAEKKAEGRRWYDIHVNGFTTEFIKMTWKLEGF